MHISNTQNKISVLIPALNEEETIGQVITIAKSNSNVDEIIVIDDNSIDRTVEIAKAAGARVITGTMLGKGSSMLDGLLVAKNNIIVYLDADIKNYNKDVIELLTRPILNGEADFVKSTFTREAGRITELVAKPLLSILFPEALRFNQPLSGIIAGKREVFQRVTFENDYGVDIGILLDAINMGAKIVEVNIGNIQHKMKPWGKLPKMAKEVAKSILKRANVSIVDFYPPNKASLREKLDTKIPNTDIKLIIFDMDNTLLKGRFIYKAAEEFGFKKNLIEIVSTNNEPYIVTKLIAKNLKGVSAVQLLSVLENIELVEDTVEIVKSFKERGYFVGIISDSYDIIANRVKNKIGADFAIANELEIVNGIATGEVRIPSYFLKSFYSICNHNICKTNVMLNLAAEYEIDIHNCIAIGDSETDVCMVKNAGLGIAFCSSNETLNSVADYVISERSFSKLLDIVNNIEKTTVKSKIILVR